MKHLTSIIALAAALTAGCRSPVPANQITIKAPSGDYRVATPKNVDITKFEATVNTQGVFSVKFDRWSSTNDPQVIDKASAGRVAEIQAYKDLIGTAVEAGASGLAKGAKGGL